MATARTADYTTSKAGVNTLTKVLAKALADLGIRVNGIAPGGIATEASLKKVVASAGSKPDYSHLCIKRPGQPEDLIGPLLFLASDASGYMSGQVLVVDGGQFMLA